MGATAALIVVHFPGTMCLLGALPLPLLSAATLPGAQIGDSSVYFYVCVNKFLSRTMDLALAMASGISSVTSTPKKRKTETQGMLCV